MGVCQGSCSSHSSWSLEYKSISGAASEDHGSYFELIMQCLLTIFEDACGCVAAPRNQTTMCLLSTKTNHCIESLRSLLLCALFFTDT